MQAPASRWPATPHQHTNTHRPKGFRAPAPTSLPWGLFFPRGRREGGWPGGGVGRQFGLVTAGARCSPRLPRCPVLLPQGRHTDLRPDPRPAPATCNRLHVHPLYAAVWAVVCLFTTGRGAETGGQEVGGREGRTAVEAAGQGIDCRIRRLSFLAYWIARKT